MKPIRLVLICIPILAVLFLGTWLGVNLWPRPMEAPLWTEAELPLPPDGAEDGYRQLVLLKDSPAFQEIDRGIDAYVDSEPLYDIWLFPFMEDRSQLALYWATVTAAGPTSEDLAAKNRAVTEAYHSLIGKPFVDRDSFRLHGPKKAPWLLMHDLSRIAALEILRQALNGETEQAHRRWLDSFAMHKEWLYSARGRLSHMTALSAVERDLSLLSLLRAFPSQSAREEILRAVSSFDPDRLNVRRALIYEYLHALDAETSVAPQALYEQSLWLRLVFNRSLFRRELNRRYRDMDLHLEDRILSEDAGLSEYRKNPFWWFYNPAGKALLWLLSINMKHYLTECNVKKDQLRSLRSKILAPEFLSMEPLKIPPQAMPLQDES